MNIFVSTQELNMKESPNLSACFRFCQQLYVIRCTWYSCVMVVHSELPTAAAATQCTHHLFIRPDMPNIVLPDWSLLQEIFDICALVPVWSDMKAPPGLPFT